MNWIKKASKQWALNKMEENFSLTHNPPFSYTHFTQEMNSLLAHSLMKEGNSHVRRYASGDG